MTESVIRRLVNDGERMETNMGVEKETVWNVNGKQVIIANDNSTVTIVHNNGTKETDELEEIIKGIMDNISTLKQEDADKIKNVVQTAKKELTSPEPKSSGLINCIKSIAPMFTIANGVPVLLSNLQRLYDLICSQLH